MQAAGAGSSRQAARSSETSPACVLRLSLSCVLILAGCGAREIIVATVDAAAIPQGDVSIELRAMLWRRGEAWDALEEATRKLRREEALDRCVEQKLLAAVSKKSAELTGA